MADEKRYIFPNRDDNPLDSVSGINSNFFTGHENTATQVLDYYVTGFSVIKWVKLPPFFEKDPDLKYFGSLTEKVFRSFQGIDDISLNMNNATVGYAAREVNFPGQITTGNSNFSLEFDEYDGLVITKLFTKWISAIRDPNTGIATYPRQYGLEYTAKNHSAELLYVALRPDVNNTDKDVVESAIYYSHVIPTNIPLSSSLNYSRGDSNHPTLTINFNAFAYIGPKVDDYARRVLRDEIMVVSDDSDGLLFLNTFDNKDESEHIGSGTLSEIYKDEQ